MGSHERRRGSVMKDEQKIEFDPSKPLYISIPTVRPNPDRRWWQVWKPRWVQNAVTERRDTKRRISAAERLMNQADYSLEVISVGPGEEVRSKVFFRCAVLIGSDTLFDHCGFYDCALLNPDGSLLVPTSVDMLPDDVAALLGPQIRAAGGLNYMRDLAASEGSY